MRNESGPIDPAEQAFGIDAGTAPGGYQVGWSQLLTDDDPGFDAFTVRLAGFEWMVTTSPTRRNDREMIDRLRAMEWATPLGTFRIRFDWSGEPAAGHPSCEIAQNGNVPDKKTARPGTDSETGCGSGN